MSVKTGVNPIMTRDYLAALLLLSCLLPLSGANAQHPGSVGYNTQVLPAHGAGDTRSAAASWGSLARSDKNNRDGWALDAPSEAAARRAAIENCAARGGIDCYVVFTFADTCAAVAATDGKSSWVHGYDLPEVRRQALRDCGSDCEIFREGCSPSSMVR